MAELKAPRRKSPRTKAVGEERRVAASEEARSGLALVTSRLDGAVAFAKNIGWLLVISGAMFTAFWNLVGKPYAQQFVQETVQETIAGLQDDLAELRVATAESQGSVAELAASHEALAAQIRLLQHATEADQDTQREILELLKTQLPVSQPEH